VSGIPDESFERSLEGMEIAISVSEPDPGELAARGVSKEHVDHAFVELARQLLAAGATLAYGGDFREKGYTHKLIALLTGYNDGRPSKERVRQYLAWPIWARGDGQHRAALNDVATVINVPCPRDDPPDPDDFDPTASPEARALRADSFTLMREWMTRSLSARVVLGGRLYTHTSRYPGVAEEAFIAAREGRPLYILGGFGGCASCLAQVIGGQRPRALSLDRQREQTPGYPELLEGLGGLDYKPFLDIMQRRGPGRIDNGLAAGDNAALLETADPDLMIALVLRGLRRLRLH
jgi:hypothetical protein